jgi:sugar phosphate isomerase/epimerase
MKVGLNPGFLFALYADKVFFNEMIEGAEIASSLGFDSLRLEVYCDQEYEAFTPENIKKLRDHYRKLNIRSDYFVACAPRNKLATMQKERREEGLRDFERTVEIAYDFGLCDTISLVCGAPEEAILKFLDTYPGAPPSMLVLPDNLSWAEIWKTYVDTVGKCLKMCQKRGLKLAIEPLPMTIMNNTDSYLRLATEINSKDFGMVMDSSHLHYQRESLPVSIEKVKGQLMSFCVCDNNSMEDYHLSPGQGTIDWREVVKTLKKIGFHGTLDLEINVATDPRKEYAIAKAYLDNIIKEVG